MTVQLPPSRPPAQAPERGAGRRIRLLPTMDMSGFLRRIGGVLDFWSATPARAGAASLEEIRDWCHEAADQRGKIAGLMAIARVADGYRQLESAGRDAFFALLRDEFAVDDDALQGALVAHAAARADGGAEARAAALVRLSRALESRRLALFEQFNTIPAGIKFLVDLRADLAARLARDPTLAPLEYELHRKLASFFNLGFLQLQRIGWDSPAALLEKLIEYEAVHHISNWSDLKHRLVSDRACYAFLHPAMPSEPVIFVEVALVQGLADSIQTLLDPEAPDLRPDQADTAIFYGISNAQSGLRGIQFGNLLIKQVVARLRGEVPTVETFATLSPLPRFRGDYLDGAIADGSVAEFYEKNEAERVRFVAQAADTAAALRELLAEPEWHRHADVAAALRPGLLRAARHYLAERLHHGHAACPVAHFHGSNGALLARINWLGDTSPNGIRQSAGIMVNYLYDLPRFELHQSDYLRTGHVAVGKDVKAL